MAWLETKIDEPWAHKGIAEGFLDIIGAVDEASRRSLSAVVKSYGESVQQNSWNNFERFSAFGRISGRTFCARWPYVRAGLSSKCVQRLAIAGPLAFRLFVTDAIDADAVSFYEKFALRRLSDAFPCRMVLDLKPILKGLSSGG